MDFSASCGSASGAVRVSASGGLRFSKWLLRGGVGVFARRMSSTLVLPEQAASRAPKTDRTIMRIMTGFLGMRCASNQDKLGHRDFQTVMASRAVREDVARLKGSVARALFIGDHLQMANCQSGRAFAPPIYCFSICSTSAKKSLNAAIPPVRRPAETSSI